ncbi:hypothetical protein DPSP01_009740 [Paraphaeosphaeria sporulosa]|uniref:DUF2470 domain-containing protein n=1 Tax=Paraphaeosphaeria sporulosa TaxID=1460663 RepID=A0A177CDY9_9PLEO|nr:uncharacterized protein CC84DRAFT_1092825 [Paraphaeosphaeria sporulosa]OAG04977.1 hypothetical protein CC84DRAFT_1092825 [Paraphaeosphaeria sporulosa]
MSTPEAQEAVISERIVKHMNADHADSVRRYLKAFKQKSISEVRDARLTGVTLNDMKFDCGKQQVIIPLDPPMKAMREARERLIQLDKEALDILGLTDIPITKYTPPYAPGLHWIHLFNFTQCLIVLTTFSRRANFKSGSLIHDNILSHVPGFGDFLFTIQPYLFYIMVGIHATETVFMARKLNRHGLTPSEPVWWAWMTSCFVEGKTCWMRLDAHIDEKLKEREAKKH